MNRMINYFLVTYARPSQHVCAGLGNILILYCRALANSISKLKVKRLDIGFNDLARLGK